MQQMRMIPRELLLEPPDPMRATMNEAALNELAESISQLGIIQPIVVAEHKGIRMSDGRFVICHGDAIPATPDLAYEIVDGHRRYLASGIAKLAEVPCVITEGPDGDNLAKMVHANIMREDVSPAEEGLLFLQLAEKHGWGIEQLMSMFKRSENYINQRVRLVQGDPRICTALVNRQIVFGVAIELLKCDDEQHRKYLLDLAITHGANIRTVAAWVQDWRRQLAAGEAMQVPVVTMPQGEQFTPTPERCLWCCKDTYPEHFERVVLHRWHLEELLRLLKQVGIHDALPSNGAAASESAQAATT